MAVKNEEETDRWRYSKFENVVFAFALAVAGVVLVTAGGVLLQERCCQTNANQSLEGQ